MPSSTKKIILALVLTLLLGTPSTKVFAETKDELMILYNSIQGDLTSGYKNSTNGITAQQNSLKTFLKFATVGNSTPTQADLDAAKKELTDYKNSLPSTAFVEWNKTSQTPSGFTKVENANGVEGKTVITEGNGTTRVTIGSDTKIYDKDGKDITKDYATIQKLAGGNVAAVLIYPATDGSTNLFPETTKPNTGPTYINDGTKICGPTGCTYTLMAPIGSLLGDSKGQYIINKNDQRGLCSLLNSWFRIGIALAGMLAVVMIVLGGFQYATTDSLFDKEDGKGKIQNALWGLLLALTTWLIVSTVNPALANCTINANEVKLSAMSTTIYNSGALGGGILGLGMAANDMALQAYGDGGVDNSDEAYNKKLDKILEQWSINDDMLSKYNDPDALAKWSRIQAQINELNNSYSSSDRGGNGKSDNAAAQRVLDKIHSGGNQCTAAHCFAGATAEAASVGVQYNMTYQSSHYKAGPSTFSERGTARMPVAGEQVDYLFTTDGRAYPGHTVIVESINPSTGRAVVWDWKQGKEQGYRIVYFKLNSPGQIGDIGRIYKASFK